MNINSTIKLLHNHEIVIAVLIGVGETDVCSAQELAELLDKHDPKEMIVEHMLDEIILSCPGCLRKLFEGQPVHKYGFCKFCGQALSYNNIEHQEAKG